MHAWIHPDKKERLESLEQELVSAMIHTIRAARAVAAGEFAEGWQNKQYPKSLRDGWTRYRYDGPWPDSLLQHYDRLMLKLMFLEFLVSDCQYYARRTVFTTGLTEIAVDLMSEQLPANELIPGSSLHPEDTLVVPFMLQPPWLRINQTQTIKDTENWCCPGHCMQMTCIQYCFNAMLEYVDRLHHPHTSLKESQFSAGDRTMINQFIIGSRLGPVSTMASLMLKRVLGPLTDFTHPITVLAQFCSCPETLEPQQDRARGDSVIPHGPEEETAWRIAYPKRTVMDYTEWMICSESEIESQRGH